MSKIVLVTGCSVGGMGFALCEEFAKQGCKVFATARRPESMDELTDPNIEKLVLDVTGDQDVQRVVDYIVEKEGRIDIVVNNAGTSAPGPIVDVNIEDFKRVFETNVFAAFRISKMVAPIMAKHKSGVIVNIGSVVADVPTPWTGVYASSKAALQTLTDVLWMECKALNISVINVSPGAIKSNIANNTLSKLSLPTGSLYSAYLPDIVQRMHSSQGSNAISAHSFAEQVVTATLKDNPPRYMRMGGFVSVFNFFQWVKAASSTGGSYVLSYMWRRFTNLAK